MPRHHRRMPEETPDLRRWIGRCQTEQATLDAAPLRGRAALLDEEPREIDAGDALGDPLPPLAHWLYFLPHEPQSALAEDGHAQRGGFMPPVALPRRMWAGSRIDFLQPLRVGDRVQRRSRIDSVVQKQGRSGALVFVGATHEIAAEGEGAAWVEQQDIVFRERPADTSSNVTEAAPGAPRPHDVSRCVVPDPVLLFRYSALTFNGHRIHYDRPYARDVEGYPGLVVHGPLVATLLANLLQREWPGVALRRIAFKVVRPLFDTAPFTLHARLIAQGRIELWACGPDGHVAVDGHAELA